MIDRKPIASVNENDQQQRCVDDHQEAAQDDGCGWQQAFAGIVPFAQLTASAAVVGFRLSRSPVRHESALYLSRHGSRRSDGGGT
jgi:hypothetical protein